MAPRTPRRCIGLSNRPSTVGDNLVRVPQPPPPRTPAQQLHRPNGSPTGSPNGRRPTTALQESLEDSRPSRRFKQPPALAHLRQMTLDAPCMPDELPAELKEGKSARGLGPHAEFALATLRDFFKKRPAQALLDAFRQQDVDRNGLIDETEFCRTLRQLNLDMPQRDMSAMFQAVDSDASGMIEFHEFYKNLRTDKFKRSDFFWGKQRPWEVLDRPQRNSLAAQLGEEDGCSRTTDEIIEIIQSKVMRKGLRKMYEVYDEDRSGAISADEFIDSMKSLGISINEYEADDVISRINQQAGINMKANVAYTTFARAFGAENSVYDDLDPETAGGVTGRIEIDEIGHLAQLPAVQGEGDGLPREMKRMATRAAIEPPGRTPRRPKPSLNRKVAQPPPVPNLTLHPMGVAAATPTANKAAKKAPAAEPRFSVVSTHRTPAAATLASGVAAVAMVTQGQGGGDGRGGPGSARDWRREWRVGNQSTDNSRASSPRDGGGGTPRDGRGGTPRGRSRHDMMAEWRGVDGKRGEAGGQLGREIMSLDANNTDWRAFERQAAENAQIFGHSPQSPQSGRLSPQSAREGGGAGGGGGGYGGGGGGGGFGGGGGRSTRLEALALSPRGRHIGTRECLAPDASSPFFIDERARLCTSNDRDASPSQDAVQRRRQVARTAAAAQRQQAHLATMRRAVDERNTRERLLDTARITQLHAFEQRRNECLQVLESREVDVGKRAPPVEPPSERSWPAAPPHKTSHWATINGVHRDPPDRTPVNYIVSYRKPFIEKKCVGRPITPPGVVWGGVHGG